MERRVNGKTTRRTLGKATGPASIGADTARKLKIDHSSELQQGIDRLDIKRKAKRESVAQAVTFKDALTDYVKNKRRTKDNLSLKARTQTDYLGMVAAPRPMLNGRSTKAGELFTISNKSIHRINAADIRDIYQLALSQSQRRADYSMQVLRAVLNWHGIQVENNPLTNLIAGKDRIRIMSPRGNPKPIPPEKLSAWWHAACNAGSTNVGGSALAGDYYRLRLLTGARQAEILPLTVADVDLTGGRLTLRDTKNRTDHSIVLSTQALEIVKKQCQGKKPTARLFPIEDPRKTLKAINLAVGLGPLAVQGHDLRDTFASVAEPLVSYLTLKRMMNHSDTGDVTGQSYVAISESQLRNAWQAVADFVARPIL
jgi:integrase